MKIRPTIFDALPLSVIFLGLLTLKTTLTCPGEPALVKYGFPFAWLMPALFTSTSYVFDLLALCVDGVAYFGIWMLILHAVRGVEVFIKYRRKINAGAWIGAGLVTLLYVLMLTTFGYRGGVSFSKLYNCQGEVHYSLEVGLP